MRRTVDLFAARFKHVFEAACRASGGTTGKIGARWSHQVSRHAGRPARLGVDTEERGHLARGAAGPVEDLTPPESGGGAFGERRVEIALEVPVTCGRRTAPGAVDTGVSSTGSCNSC
jgi:hypothetical protein